ncbi:VOC family protein [Iodidimonas sp. SYSU 1G8]|uniref:VOC family protein n=1 Tax=Iodidimonas sp. SYSU 1G8 TaxID=3133967 RepID=UPI0031FE54E8
MKVYGIQILVDDYAAARAFYVDTLGLELAWEMAEVGAFGVVVEPVQFIVTTAGEEALLGGTPGRFVGVSIAVEDMDAVYGDLTARGVPFNGPPEPQPWGGTLAYFRDPSGNVLTLMA